PPPAPPRLPSGPCPGPECTGEQRLASASPASRWIPTHCKCSYTAALATQPSPKPSSDASPAPSKNFLSIVNRSVRQDNWCQARISSYEMQIIGTRVAFHNTKCDPGTNYLHLPMSVRSVVHFGRRTSVACNTMGQ